MQDITSNFPDKEKIKIEFIYGDNENKFCPVPATVYFSLSPRPNMMFKLNDVRQALAIVSTLREFGKVSKVCLPDSSAKFQVIEVESNIDLEGRIAKTFIPNEYPFTLIDTGEPIKSVEFTLINCLSLSKCKNTNLTVKQWTIEITSIKNESVKKSQNQYSEYRITHTGKLLRSDGHTFTSEEAKVQLKILQLFLSFARGGSCGIGTAAGIDNKGNFAWKYFLVGLPIHRWLSLDSWSKHNYFNIDLHAEAFSGFWHELKDKLNVNEEEDPIYLALYWYLRANQSDSPYTSVVLAQIALERLSSIILSDFEWIKMTSLKRRLKLALQKCNINLNVPLVFSGLSSTKKDEQCAPALLVDIRNHLIHSNRNEKNNFSFKDYLQAKDLGLWYVELLLLWIFKYQGQYSNRITLNWEGKYELEFVPWVRENI